MNKQDFLNQSTATSTMTSSISTDTTTRKNDDTRSNNSDDDDDDNSLYEDIGIMFDGFRDTILRHFSWERSGGNMTNSPIHVALNCVDEEPGAVQSGHYLWPGSLSLCEYLVSQHNLQQRGYGTTKAENNCTIIPSVPVNTILELGAGTGLVSLTALQLFQDTVELLVVTDHDPSSLERARDNYETTMTELYEHAEGEEGKENVINEIASIPVEFIHLKWGKEAEWKELQKTVTSDHNFMATRPPITFDMVLGSDLIYAFDVVEPLLRTAARAMRRKDGEEAGGRFILSQSFIFEEETETEIDRVCDELQLERIVLLDDLSQEGSRIQEFRRKMQAMNKD